MTSKEFFQKIGRHMSFEGFEQFLESVPEFEIQDEIFSNFEDNYLTRDRAITDRQIAAKMKFQNLNPIDSEVKNILRELGYANDHEINKEADTYKKIALLTKEIPAALERAGKGSETNEEFKNKLKQKDDALAQLAKKVEEITAAANSEKDALKSEFEGRIHDIHLNSELENLSRTYTFADAYEATRPQLQNALLGDIRKNNKLQLATNDTGGAEIRILDESGAPRFNGNTPVTIKSLLDSAYKPFLKQSNADGQQQQAQGQTTQQRYTVGGDNNQSAMRAGARSTVQ